MKNHKLAILQLNALLTDSTNTLGNLANTASFLYQELGDINWAGFYFHDEKTDTLKLGPFCGKVACMTIKNNHGVCGTAFFEQQPQLVKNVHKFCGHIACDVTTNSELVVPLSKGGKPLGVIDLDSTTLNRFNEQDLHFVSQVSALLEHYLNSEVIRTAINI